MSQVSSTVTFSDLKDWQIPAELRPLIEELVRRLDVQVGQVVGDLRAEPTLFPVDPFDIDNAAAIEGAKPGDVAVWTDSDGDTQVHAFS